jgi:hypothetical protein
MPPRSRCRALGWGSCNGRGLFGPARRYEFGSAAEACYGEATALKRAHQPDWLPRQEVNTVVGMPGGECGLRGLGAAWLFAAIS